MAVEQESKPGAAFGEAIRSHWPSHTVRASQENAAAALGVKWSTVRSIVGGHRGPSKSLMARIRSVMPEFDLNLFIKE